MQQSRDKVKRREEKGKREGREREANMNIDSAVFSTQRSYTVGW